MQIPAGVTDRDLQKSRRAAGNNRWPVEDPPHDYIPRHLTAQGCFVGKEFIVYTTPERAIRVCRFP